LNLFDPLSPSFPVNAARMVGRLTRGPLGGRVAVWLRPCEIRALTELIKLHQASRDDLIVFATDCPGAYAGRDLAALTAGRSLEKVTAEFPADPFRRSDRDEAALASACRACDRFTPEGADVAISWTGDRPPVAEGRTEAGANLLAGLGLDQAQTDPGRSEAVNELVRRRRERLDQMAAETAEAVDSPDKLSGFLEACVGCLNCRVACPVCYCRECVLATDAFDHEPGQYLNWARRKGAVRLPTDTLFYHLTRLTHMSHACVGCGQCSNACPNDVPVLELFRTVSRRTQAAFEYQAGMDPDQPPPLAVFFEDEFPEALQP
jgi:formate dehydrogenase subunit beta